jgi:hypothetical protein
MTKPGFSELQCRLLVYIPVCFYVSQRLFCVVKLTRKMHAVSNFVVPHLGRIQSRMTKAIQTMPARRDKIILTCIRISQERVLHV